MTTLVVTRAHAGSSDPALLADIPNLHELIERARTDVHLHQTHMLSDKQRQEVNRRIRENGQRRLRHHLVNLSGEPHFDAIWTHYVREGRRRVAPSSRQYHLRACPICNVALHELGNNTDVALPKLVVPFATVQLGDAYFKVEAESGRIYRIVDPIRGTPSFVSTGRMVLSDGLWWVVNGTQRTGPIRTRESSRLPWTASPQATQPKQPTRSPLPSRFSRPTRPSRSPRFEPAAPARTPPPPSLARPTQPTPPSWPTQATRPSPPSHVSAPTQSARPTPLSSAARAADPPAPSARELFPGWPKGSATPTPPAQARPSERPARPTPPPVMLSAPSAAPLAPLAPAAPAPPASPRLPRPSAGSVPSIPPSDWPQPSAAAAPTIPSDWPHPSAGAAAAPAPTPAIPPHWPHPSATAARRPPAGNARHSSRSSTPPIPLSRATPRSEPAAATAPIPPSPTGSTGNDRNDSDPATPTPSQSDTSTASGPEPHEPFRR